MSSNIVFGHNKFYKLKELLERHFRKNNGEHANTRAIVFVEVSISFFQIIIYLKLKKNRIIISLFKFSIGI